MPCEKYLHNSIALPARTENAAAMPGSASKPVSLSVWLVLAGVAGGIFAGLFFGDYAALLKPVGNVYAMLLEVAVYPYLVCSLLHGLGRMTPVEALKLLRKGWIFYVALWALVFGMLIVLSTGIPVAALPYITAATQKLAERCGIDDPERGDVIRTNISIAYPFGQLGNFFVYLFVIFAASMNGVEIPALKEWLLPAVSLISCVGSPTSSVDSVTFLSGWLGLPEGTTAFYVGLMALTRYGQVIVSVAGFAFLSFAVTLAYYGKIRLRPLSGLVVIAAALVIAGAAGWGGRRLSARLQEGRVSPYLC